MSAETWRGLTLAPEHRCSPYDRKRDYPYPQSIDQDIIRELGAVYGPYTGTCFGSRTAEPVNCRTGYKQRAAGTAAQARKGKGEAPEAAGNGGGEPLRATPALHGELPRRHMTIPPTGPPGGPVESYMSPKPCACTRARGAGLEGDRSRDARERRLQALRKGRPVGPPFASRRTGSPAPTSIQGEEAHADERNAVNLETILWIPSAPPARTRAVKMASVIRKRWSWRPASANAPMIFPSSIGMN